MAEFKTLQCNLTAQCMPFFWLILGSSDFWCNCKYLGKISLNSKCYEMYLVRSTPVCITIS